MGGVVDTVGDVVGGVGGAVNSAVQQVPGVGQVLGPAAGMMLGQTPLSAFGSSLGSQLFTGRGGNGGGDGGGGGGDGGAGPVPYTPYTNPFLPTLYPNAYPQNTAPLPPVQDTAPVPPVQNTAPYRPNPPPLPLSAYIPRQRSPVEQRNFELARQAQSSGPLTNNQIRLRETLERGGRAAANQALQQQQVAAPPQLGSGQSPLRQNIMGPNRAPVGGIANLNRQPFGSFGRR